MRQVVRARCRSSGGCDGREAVLAEDGLGTTHVARQQGIAKLGLLNGLAHLEHKILTYSTCFCQSLSMHFSGSAVAAQIPAFCRFFDWPPAGALSGLP